MDYSATGRVAANHRSSIINHQSAFTLIETLIAIAIIALIMAMVYGSYAATTQSLQRYESRTTCRERADLVLRLMTRQIRCAFAPVAEPNDGKSPGNSHEPVAAPAPIFRGNGANPQGEFLTFLTTAGSSAGTNMSQTLVSTGYQYDSTKASLSIRQSPAPADSLTALLFPGFPFWTVWRI